MNMEINGEYYIDNKKFYTRSDFLQYCINHDRDISNGSFVYPNLPENIDIRNYVPPIDASKEWLLNLKKRNKPLVLLLSGGVDSAFALKSMIHVGCPPDFILIYNLKPFNTPLPFCSYSMEPTLAMEYFKNLKSVTPSLKNTKIWEIKLGEEYAEEYYSNTNWPLMDLGYHHGVDTMAYWLSLPAIPDEIKNKFTFIKGGDFPEVHIDGHKMSFYIVDLKLADRLDRKRKETHDFIIDNPLMFSSMCISYAKNYKKNINNQSKNKKMILPYNKGLGSKYLLDIFIELSKDIPPQLDKRFGCLREHRYKLSASKNNKLVELCSQTNLKSWMLYLECELNKPKWYEYYKNALTIHKDWIEKSNSFSGLITEPLTIDIRKI